MTLDVEVHPNPVDDGQLTIDIYNSERDSYQLKLYDSSGKVVLRRDFKVGVLDNKHTFTISIPEITAGMYILHILSEDKYAKELLIIR